MRESRLPRIKSEYRIIHHFWAFWTQHYQDIELLRMHNIWIGYRIQYKCAVNHLCKELMTIHNLLADKIVNNTCIIEHPAPIVVRRCRHLLIECAHAVLRQSTSSVESIKEEAEPRCCVIFNANLSSETVEPITLINPIALLMCKVQRRLSLIFQGVAVDEENDKLVQIYFAWQADTGIPVLFKASITLDAQFLSNIPVNGPYTPIYWVKPSGRAQYPNLLNQVGKGNKEKRRRPHVVIVKIDDDLSADC
jgi:hypothetical protein